MRRSRTRTLLSLLLVIALALVSLESVPGPAAAAPPVDVGARRPPAPSPSSVVVRLRLGFDAQDLSATLAAHGARVDRSIGHRGLVRVKLQHGADANSVLAALRHDPAVAEAGLDLAVQSFDTPNDPGYRQQWDLQDGVGGIDAQGAWDLSTGRGAGIVVAVIDTGLAYEDFTGGAGLFGPKVFKRAPDLEGVPIVAPWDWVDGDSHANDENGHGTHVAGTIAEATNNGLAEAGMSAASLMPLKILDYSGNGSGSDLIDALYYAADHGARVINLSLGFSGTGSPDANGNVCSEIVGLADGLDYAYAMGVTVVAASGNDGAATVACPAAYPTVIAVGATRYDGAVTSYSNRGSALSVTAPGGDPGVDQNNDGVADQITQQTYCLDTFTLLLTGAYSQFCDMLYSGTSMASPHVAGAIALLIGQLSTLSPDQIRDALEATARDRGAPGWDPEYGWGQIDARAALATIIANPPPPPPPGPAPQPRPTPQPGATNVSATALNATSIRLNWTDNATNESGFRIERSPDGVSTWTYAGNAGANATAYTNYSLAADTQYWYRVRSYDSQGSSPWSATVTASTLPPPPAPTGLSAMPLSATSIRLSWTDNSATEQGFKIERSLDGLNFSVTNYASVNATTATVGSLMPSTTYWFRVFGYDGTATGDRSNTARASTFDLPVAPANLAATTLNTTSILLSWTDLSSTEQGFRVERSTDGGTTWSQAGLVAANTTKWTNYNLVPGTAYWYRVRGFDGSYNGDPSNIANATTLAPPSPPSNLAATTVDPSTIRLNWVDTSSYEQGFKIERSSDAGATWSQIGTAAANSTAYSALRLTPSTQYSFRVRSYEGTTNGDYSEVATATTFDPPSSPANLAGEAISTTSIKLSWTNTSAIQTAISVERSDDGVTWKQVTSLSATTTTWTNYLLSAGTTYSYRVRAAAGITFGAYSATISAATLPPPSPPTNLTAVALSATSVKLTWTDTCSYESGFRVERSVDGITWTPVAQLTANTTSWTNSSLTTKTAYQYRVRAYQGTVNGEFSPVVIVTTP